MSKRDAWLEPKLEKLPIWGLARGSQCERAMAKRRAEQAPVGVTSNGVLVVNILGLLSSREAAKLRRALPTRLGEDWFVGTAIRGREVVKMLARFDDAAAEAAAQFAGRARRPAAKRTK